MTRGANERANEQTKPRASVCVLAPANSIRMPQDLPAHDEEQGRDDVDDDCCWVVCVCFGFHCCVGGGGGGGGGTAPDEPRYTAGMFALAEEGERQNIKKKHHPIN